MRQIQKEPERQVENTREAGPTLASQLTEQLRGSILNGAAQPGSKLRLDELRNRYGVSLSPVREALTRLSVEGLVVGRLNRGFRVASISSGHINEVTVLRRDLEGLAIQELVHRGDDDWEDQLVAAFHRLKKIDDQYAKVGDLEAWERAHRKFHMSLINACGMPILLQFCEILHDHSDRYRRLFVQRGKADSRVAEEHKAILEAALARDGNGAKALLIHHINRTNSNIQLAMSGKKQGERARGGGKNDKDVIGARGVDRSFDPSTRTGSRK